MHVMDADVPPTAKFRQSVELRAEISEEILTKRTVDTVTRDVDAPAPPHSKMEDVTDTERRSLVSKALKASGCFQRKDENGLICRILEKMEKEPSLLAKVKTLGDFTASPPEKDAFEFIVASVLGDIHKAAAPVEFPDGERRANVWKALRETGYAHHSDNQRLISGLRSRMATVSGFEDIVKAVAGDEPGIARPSENETRKATEEVLKATKPRSHGFSSSYEEDANEVLTLLASLEVKDTTAFSLVKAWRTRRDLILRSSGCCKSSTRVTRLSLSSMNLASSRLLWSKILARGKERRRSRIVVQDC